MPKIMGVYILRNLDNGNEYVGSSVDVKDRINHHFLELKRNCHHNSKLQNSFNKYNGNFSWSLVEKVFDRDNLHKREKWWIDALNPKLNIRRDTFPTRKPDGKKSSEEHKQKLKDAWTDKRRKEWSEYKIGHSSSLKGKKLPNSFGDNVSKGHRLNDNPVILLSPDNKVYTIYNLNRFCKENNLPRHRVRLLLSNSSCKYLPDWKVIDVGWATNHIFGNKIVDKGIINESSH